MENVYDFGQLGRLLPQRTVEEAVRSLVETLKLKRVRRARIYRSFSSILIEVPGGQEAQAGFAALSAVACMPTFRVSVGRIPWWKFWVQGIRVIERSWN